MVSMVCKRYKIFCRVEVGKWLVLKGGGVVYHDQRGGTEGTGTLMLEGIGEYCMVAKIPESEP